MSSTEHAEEISDDYRYSLESLQSPDRYAINNLTVIAKENTACADAISNVLLEHIRKAPPHHKLPALYVLDSIAKNIGSPYTQFLGAKLYSTFMGAYSSVDQSTRRKMDDVLKTWKAPIPGAIDPRPVFPVEITKKIENALIQAKTAALRHDQNNPLVFAQKRPGSAVGLTQWRNTPTPPQHALQYAPPNPAQLQLQQGSAPPNYSQPQLGPYNATPAPVAYYQQGGTNSPFPGYPQPVPTPIQSFAPYQSGPQHNGGYHTPVNHGIDIGLLNLDIDRLIGNCRQQFSANTQDAQKLTKLQALLQLQKVVAGGQLPIDQLFNVRRQVDELQAVDQREQAERMAYHQPPAYHAAAHSVAPTPVQTMLNQVNQMPVAPPSAPPISILPPAPTPSGLYAAPPDLASLLAGVGRQGTTPAPPAVSTVSAGKPSNETIAPAQNYSSLLASLTKSGVVTDATPRQTPVSASSQLPVQPAAPSIPVPNQSLAALLALATSKAPVMPPNHVELSSPSLKIPRPHLVTSLRDKLPNQCVTCGRRFPTGTEGKAQKEKHMDWHFRTNQRIQDASKGIQNRSWYIGEMEWIKSKESDGEQDTDAQAGQVRNDSTNGQMSAKESYISVPSDPEANQPCPICQEAFETGFNQEIQDWVWLDAMKVGNKIYHASCYADVKRGEPDISRRTATPDSVLGKRKAERSVTDESPAKRPA